VPDLRVEVWTLNSEASEDNAEFIQSAKKLTTPTRGCVTLIAVRTSLTIPRLQTRQIAKATEVAPEDVVFEWQCEAIQRIFKQLGARSPFVHRTPNLDAELLRALFRACPIVVARDSQVQNLIASRPAGFSFQPFDETIAES